jgi:hypothetical protein
MYLRGNSIGTDDGRRRRRRRTTHFKSLLLYDDDEAETYFTAFCTRISKFVDDKINYAFSSAFTTSPDGIPQPHIIPNDDNDEMDEVKWYTSAHTRQNEQSNKRVCFSKSTKPPKPILHETTEIEFKLGMNIIFKDGTGKSGHVVYKGATANGMKQVIRRIDGSRSNIDQSHLSFTNQIGFKNIP